MSLEQVLPADVEKRSFKITTKELGNCILDPESEAVIEHVIHTTADFGYADNLISFPRAMTKGSEALRFGTPIITDTNIGKAGISKTTLHKTGSEVYYFTADEDAAKATREVGITRTTASMGKAAALSSQGKDYIFAIGNAPIALIRIKELVDQGKFHPELIIAVPAGFANVVQAKELILDLDIPYIVARGWKGGSNVTTTIYNAPPYQLYI